MKLAMIVSGITLGMLFAGAASAGSARTAPDCDVDDTGHATGSAAAAVRLGAASGAPGMDAAVVRRVVARFVQDPDPALLVRFDAATTPLPVLDPERPPAPRRAVREVPSAP